MRRVIRVVIHETEAGRYQKGSSRNIIIPLMGKDTKGEMYTQTVTIDEVQNIILNALARYGIKHKYSWKE